MARKLKEVDEQVNLTGQDEGKLTITEQTYQAISDANRHSKCGGTLRATRESQGLTVHEIASRLRLSPKQIEAIETDNYAVLPEPTIVRGFIRNYAKLLKLDAQPLLDAYIVIVPTAMPYKMAVKPTGGMRMSSKEKSKSSRYALAALALLLVVGVWLFYQHYVAKPSPIQPSASASSDDSAAVDNATSAPVEAVLPEAALPVAERATEPAATNAQTSTALTLPTLPTTGSPASLPTTSQVIPAVTVNPATSPATSPSVALPAASLPTKQSNTQLPNSQLTASTSLSAPADRDSVNASDPLPTPMPNGVGKLEFNASQETWVNIVDASDREVYNKVIFAGSRESIDVKPPVKVTVGNASGTSMSMNGKPVELAPHTRNNVAHIKLNN